MILYSKKIKSSCWDLVWHFGTQLACLTSVPNTKNYQYNMQK